MTRNGFDARTGEFIISIGYYTKIQNRFSLTKCEGRVVDGSLGGRGYLEPYVRQKNTSV
jgi:hypothetical protein